MHGVRRIALFVALGLAAVGVAVAAPPALATTYCVGKLSGDSTGFVAQCTGAGGILASSVDVAADEATTSGTASNTIFIGPGTYAFHGEADDASGKAIHVVGSGPDVTVLDSGSGSTDEVLRLTQPGSSAVDLAIAQSTDPSTSLDLSGGASASTVAVTVALGHVHNILPVRVSGAGSLSHVTVSMLEDASHPNSSIDDGVFVAQGIANGTVTIADSTIEGGDGVVFENAGNSLLTLAMERDHVIADFDGVVQNALAASATTTISSSLIDMSASTFGSATAISTAPNSTGGMTATMNVLDDTLIGSGVGATTGVYTVNDSTDTAIASTAISGTVIEGFGGAIDREGNSGTLGKTVVGASASVFDPARVFNDLGGPGTITSVNDSNAAPGFVDAAAGDYHLRWDSPLIDQNGSGGGATNESATDLDGVARPTLGIPGGNDRLDIGAYEYRPLAPTVVASAPASGAPGAGVTFSAVGTDQSAPETAALAYTWSFSDGTTASGASVVHALPASGTLTGTVTVTDPTSLTATGSAQTSVVAPPAPAPGGGATPTAGPGGGAPTGTPGGGAPAGSTALAVTFGRLVAKLSALLAGAPVALSARLNEAASLSGKLELRATTVATVKHKKKLHVRTIVLGSSSARLTAAGSKALVFRLSKPVRKQLAAERRLKGAKLAYVLVTTAVGPAGVHHAATVAVTVR